MILIASQPQPHNTTPHTDTLKQSVAGLLRVVPADKVFAHNGSLHIVLGAEAVRSIQQYKQMLEQGDWNTTGYPYTLHVLQDVCQGLDEGKFLYTDIFQPERQVYDSGHTVLPIPIPIPLPLRLARMIQKSREEFLHGYKRSQGFHKAAARMLESGEPELAAFMLHQSVEQLLRGFHMAITGQEVKTHMLSELVKHIRHYAPVVWNCCGSVGGDGRTLITLLEKAYICGRYAPHFKAEPKILEDCMHQVAGLQEAVAASYHNSEQVYKVCHT